MWDFLVLKRCVPRVTHEVPGVFRRDVLGYGHVGVDPLDVLEGLVGVEVDSRLGRRGVEGEEARHRAVQPVAVEVVAGEFPLGEQDCDHRIAGNKNLFLDREDREHGLCGLNKQRLRLV
jgi:hypothetical protein